MVRNSLKDKYWKQKAHAKERDIEFTLTYQEWIDWWGEDIKYRGRGMGKLQMCRKDDKGGYTLGNIFKATHEQNQKDKAINGTHKARPRSLDDEQHEEVMQALAYGFTTREVAKAMGVSQRTVIRANHCQGAYV